MQTHYAPRFLRPIAGVASTPSAAVRYGSESAARAHRPALAPWQARRIEAFVAANLSGALRVPDLAAVVGLKPRYFTKAFNGSFGVSPHVYVVERRIEQACVMLRDTNEALAQIAVSCGLYDQSHMTRIFRRLRGETPAAWRRSRLAPRRAA
ncbi:AraC family transcriptional regulator [Caulobacter sp. 602-1]|uniref:helix-turn-helix domain-containing protein n=1 Tax=Caulobacter sp. 602-1 TaxID=2492472 RepID=UPI0013151A50|nr:AraC family transcriptional regulator [Caulobacter sp. 602-1]